MFDLNLDGTIERDEMFNIMMMFLEVLYFLRKKVRGS
jgi:hypothetical protein